jgi:hypothetical protein
MHHVASPRFAALLLPLAAIFAPGCVVEQASEIDVDAEMTDEATDEIVTVRHEKQLAQGRDHACAIKAGGALYCWGTNKYGQIGDNIAPSPGGNATCQANTTEAAPCHTNPQPVVGMGSSVTHVSAGMYHTCAIKAGQVSCWGRTMHGCVGIPLSPTNCGAAWTSMPQPVSLPEAATDIAVGVYHSCAATTSGRVFCWGLTSQIGNPNGEETFCGTLHGHDTPVEVFFPGVPTNVKAVTRIASAPSRNTTCALHVDGGVSCWGGPDEGANPDADNMGDLVPQAVVRGHGTANATRMTGASAVAVQGNRGACALFAGSGTVECWAKSGDTGCGRGGSAYHCSPEPTPVLEQTATGTTTLVNAVQLSGGESMTCAMTTDNTPRCWGYNDTCVVGSGPFHMPAAKRMTNADGSAIKTAWSIALGQQTSCVRRQDGTIYCLGADAQAEHGDSTATTPHCSQNRGGGTLLMTAIP